jgi:hypothetical protein
VKKVDIETLHAKFKALAPIMDQWSSHMEGQERTRGASAAPSIMGFCAACSAAGRRKKAPERKGREALP